MRIMVSQIHKFTVSGKKFLLDVGSGAVHELDDLAWNLIDDYVRAVVDSDGGSNGRERKVLERLWCSVSHNSRDIFERWSRDQIEECVREFEELRGSGALLRVPPRPSFRRMPLKALCLNVSDDCNLRCSYCFARPSRKPVHMPVSVARKAVDLLFQDVFGPPALEIDFFGGEPLLNPGVVRETVSYAKSTAAARHKTVSFTLTTNATLLDDEICDYLDREMENVILSLDGRPTVHDRFRRYAGGRGSYSRVLDGALRFAERRNGKGYYVRGTYTRFNLDFADDVLELVRLGFDNVSMEPVVAGPEAEYAIREEDVPVIEREYERLAECLRTLEGRGRRVRFFHFELNTSRSPCLPKLYSGCGAGAQYLAVTPEGDLFPCHQLTHVPRFRVGDVFEGVWNEGIANEFAVSNLVDPLAVNSEDVREDSGLGGFECGTPCVTCWARFYCGGGCRANALLINGDMRKPDPIGCRLLKKRVECALYLAASRAEQQYSGSPST